MSHHEDDERIILSSAEIAEGFAAVMGRFRHLDEDEVQRLRERAESTVLGHEAYALGQEYLARGDHGQAQRWLQMAVEHGVPGAERDLEQLALRHALDLISEVSFIRSRGEEADDKNERSPVISVGAVLCPVGAGDSNVTKEPWAAVLNRIHAERVAAAARREATHVKEQARREADEVLAEARRQAQVILDDARTEAEHILGDAHQQAKAVLSAARREAETVPVQNRAVTLSAAEACQDPFRWLRPRLGSR